MVGGEGWEMDEDHRGITSPTNADGMAWLRGLGGGSGMGNLRGEGWIQPEGSGIMPGYMLQTVKNPAHDVYWEEKYFRDKYYTPYKREAITEPVWSLGGPQEGGEVATGSEFAEGSYVDPVTGQEVSGLFATGGGPDPAVDITNLTTTFELAQKAYDDLIKQYTWEEGHDEYDIATEQLEEAELDARLARQDIEGDKPEAYETAAAAEAKTGMAYSGPAATATAAVTDAAQTALGAQSRKMREAQAEYDEAEAFAEEAIYGSGGAEEVWKAEQESYYGDMSNLASEYGRKTGGPIQQLNNLIMGLVGAHKGMGEHPKKMAADASHDKKYAMADAGMWQEEAGNIPATKAFLDWLDMPGGPADFATVMQDVMAQAMQDVPDVPDAPSEGTGG